MLERKYTDSMCEGQKRSFTEIDDDQTEIDLRAEQQELRRQNQGRLVIVIGEENGDNGDSYSEIRHHNHQHQHQISDQQQNQDPHNNKRKKMKVSVRSFDSKEKLKIFYRVFDTVNRITQSAEDSGQLSGYSSINSVDEMSNDDRLNPSSSLCSTSCRPVNSVASQQNIELLKKREIVSALLQKFCFINEP